MRQFSLTWLLFFCIVSTVFAQKLETTRPLNKETKLYHDIAVYAYNASLKEQFTKEFLKKMGTKQSDINITNDISAVPDVIFIFGEPGELLSQARKNATLPVIINLSSEEIQSTDYPVIQAANSKAAAGKAANFIKKLYYQGMRPRNSVIFENGKDGHHTYRIPSVLTLPNGNIIAITEARSNGVSDCAENDIVLKISEDEGKTWGSLITAAESGQSSLNNPVGVYISERNRVIIMYQEYPPKLNEGSASSGFDGNITRTYISVSDDGGKTWQPKRDITKQAKQPDATGYASGPGIGIRVMAGQDKGRIIIPLNASGGKDGWFNYLVYSDDLGDSWNILPGHSSYGTNESQIIQVSDTEFLINARCHRFPGDDIKAPAGWNPWNFDKVTRFRGMIPLTIQGTQTQWGVTKVRTDMPNPLCQGAIFRYSGLKTGEKSRVLFSNPASQLTAPMDGRRYTNTPPARINGTVAISYDDATTWSDSKRIYGNRFTEFQYSVLTNLGNGKIGCMFEAHPEIRFAVFDIEWLTSGKDKGKN